MIQALLTSNHPQINVVSLYTFLWCIWKSRNDNRFCRTTRSPSQVFAAAMAIMQGTNLEVAARSLEYKVVSLHGTDKDAPVETLLQRQDQLMMQSTPSPGETIKDISCFSGPIVYTDAAQSLGFQNQPTVAGIGIFIQFAGDRRCSQLCISAVSPPTTSAIQAEAFSMMLAYKIAERLQIQQGTFLMDSSILATAIAASKPILAPGHWTIRPQLACITDSSAFNATRIYHINRSYNFRAHHQARLAIKTQNSLSRFTCLGSGNGSCLNAVLAALSSELQCKVVLVRCC